jgi:hypothetical protein
MLPSSLVSQYNARAPFDGNAAISGIAGTGPALGYDLHRCLNVVKMVYNFATLGGALANIVCPDDQGNPILIPFGALIKRSYTYVQTAVTSGGAATIGISSGQAANDLLAQTGKASFSLNALVDGIPTGTMATAVLITTVGGVVPYILPAVATLTAGAFEVFIEYVLT